MFTSPQMPLQLPFVAPIVSELVDDTRSLICGLTTLQKQFLAALFVACADAASASNIPTNGFVGSDESAVQHRRLIPAAKSSVYSCYCRLCETLGAGAPSLSMLVLFRECVGALSDLNFIRSINKDMLDLTVDPDDLFAALRSTTPLVYNALLRLCTVTTSISSSVDTNTPDKDSLASLYTDFLTQCMKLNPLFVARIIHFMIALFFQTSHSHTVRFIEFNEESLNCCLKLTNLQR